MPLSNLVVAYFSTMALLYLAYSTAWKKISSEKFLVISNILALVVAVIVLMEPSCEEKCDDMAREICVPGSPEYRFFLSQCFDRHCGGGQ